MQTRQVTGSVSIFLALTITMMLSFCMVLIQSARENAMLLKADITVDTAVKSIMAEYHQTLWESYDLLYIDSSYGDTLPNYEYVKQHVSDYVEENLQYDNVAWFSLAQTDSKLSNVLLASNEYGSDFYLQAVKAMEASIGISYIEQILEWFEQVDSIMDTQELLESESQKANEVIEQVNGTQVEVEEAVWGEDQNGNPIIVEEAEYETVDIENPLDQILSDNLLLGQIIENHSDISNAWIDVSQLASHRQLAVGTKKEKLETDGIWNKALFCKYAIDHFTSYVDQKEDTEGLQYPLEYIIGGKSSDNQNMEVVTMKLLVIREIDNYLNLLKDDIKRAEADAIGAAAATLVPWVAPIVSQATLICWAYEESIEELQHLFQGKSIPLLKSLGLEGVSEVTLSYEEYLYLLMLMQNRETLTMRTIDMIEADIRKEQEDFRIDGCISKADITMTLQDIYEKEYTITKTVRYQE